MKAKTADEVTTFQDIPNVGPAMARDFLLLDIMRPKDLKNKNAYVLYQKLCNLSGGVQDPCVLDTFIAVIDFMHGAPARPWWYYTNTRKQQYPDLAKGSYLLPPFR